MDFLQLIINSLALSGIYALLALGLAMVYSILGLINFAHGELITVSVYAFVGAMLAGVPFWLSCAIAIVAGTLAAVLMERIGFRLLRGASLETLLLSSFAISVVLQTVFALAISPKSVPVPTPAFFRETLQFGDYSVGVLEIVAVTVSLVAVLALRMVLKRSRLGLNMVAAGIDFEMSRLNGVKANRMYLLAFALSGLLAATAGLLWAFKRGSVDPGMGLTPVIVAFLAIVLGGLGSLNGAIVGGLFLGFSEVILNEFLPSAVAPFRFAIVASLVVLLLLVKPNGLLSRSKRSAIREL
jgi:branched-chain amino acid transport system permease protein